MFTITSRSTRISTHIYACTKRRTDVKRTWDIIHRVSIQNAIKRDRPHKGGPLYYHHSLTPLGLSLLLQVCFDTPLPRLSLIVLPLRLFLLRCIAGQTCNSTTNRTTKPISDALAEVVNQRCADLRAARSRRRPTSSGRRR